MGLDQYLSVRKFVSGGKHSKPESQKEYKALLKAIGIKHSAKEVMPFAEVKLTIAYWRKANQIHAWFVKEVQNGQDDCKPYSVGRQKLQELVNVCKFAIDNQGSASTVLPTSSGFFFGSTNYDGYYYDDLRLTVEQIQAILDNPSFADSDFTYQSSW